MIRKAAVQHRFRLLKTLGFVFIPMASIASPLLAIPAITTQFGAAGWTAVAVGQSVGASFAVIVELGWGLTGPQRVAKQATRLQKQTLAIALLSKSVVLVPLSAAAGLIGFVLSPNYQLESALVAVGATTFGLNNMWYYIGTGSPARILLTDALPRLTCITATSLGILLGAPLITYPILAVLLPTLISSGLVIALEGIKPRQLLGITVLRLARVIRLQGTALGGRAFSAVYISLPITLVTLVSPASVPVFSAIERLQRIYMQVLAAVPNMMQNWIGQSTAGQDTLRNARRAILYNSLLGIASGTAFALALPTLAELVFSQTIAVPGELGPISGLLIAIVCTSRASGSIALVALRRLKTIMISALVGAAVGIPAILIGAKLFGTAGALLGELMAEAVVLVVQLTAVRRASTARSRGRHRADKNHRKGR